MDTTQLGTVAAAQDTDHRTAQGPETIERPLWQQVIALVGFIALCFSAAALGSLFTASEIPSWYAGIRKPTWNPPNWVFGPVWTTLYLMMAVAVWLVWRKHPWRASRWALIVFGVQLTLNSLWSIIFFGMHNPGGALIEIVFLWVAIAATILLFRRFSLAAALLLVPYLIWVSFASFLNFTLWRLNS